MGVVDRIIEFAENEGVTVFEIERKIGASKGVLYRASKQGSDIQAKWLTLLVDNYPLLSPLWLLTGRGDIYMEHQTKKMREANISVSNHGSIAGGIANTTPSPVTSNDINAETLRLQLQEKDRQIAQKDEQINQLLALLSSK